MAHPDCFMISFIFLLIISLKPSQKTGYLFSILTSEIGLFFSFEVALSPQHPTNSCRRELVSRRLGARRGKLPVGFRPDANSQFPQPEAQLYE